MLTGLWIVVILNILTAFGSIWIFLRMRPAIEVILEENDRSLLACEEMLSALAFWGMQNPKEKQDPKEDNKWQKDFHIAYKKAEQNITEKNETLVLQNIEKLIPLVFHNSDVQSREQAHRKMIANIAWLASINREAMLEADRKAQQLGSAGAWGLVFMTISVFSAILIFKLKLTQKVLDPLEELYDVMQAQKSGDSFRRLSHIPLAADLRIIFTEVNRLLDK